MIVNPFAVFVPARRIINPSPSQWALIGLGSALLVGGLASAAWGASRARKPSDLPDVGPSGPDCDPSPYELDESLLRMMVAAEVDDGHHDKAQVAITVATQLFGSHPSGVEVSFPPPDDSPQGVTCVWDWTVWTVDLVFDERGIVDEPSAPSGPSDSLNWVLRTANDPGYPWEDPVMHITNWPTPGMFVDAGNQGGTWNPEHGYDSMIKAYLGSALAMAGADVDLAENSEGQELRKQLRQAVMYVGGFNDLLYGQTNLNYAGGNDPDAPGGKADKPKSGAYVLNSRGRGLNWLPRHKDQKARIQAGEPLKRATSLSGGSLHGTNKGMRQMLIYLPALDLAALRLPVPKIAFLKWSDGSSTINPPPQIQALGYDLSGVNLPGVQLAA